MIDHFLGDAFGALSKKSRSSLVMSCQFWNTVLQCVALLPIHTLNYWTVQSLVSGFYLGVCLSVTGGGRSASVSACADLTNQLQCCWVDPACAWKKH